MMAISCGTDPLPAPDPAKELDVFAKAVPTGYYAVANVTVPLATDVVYIEYKGADGHIKTVSQAVSPKMITPEDGKGAEPFGTVSLLLQSKKPCKVSIWYKPLEGEVKGSEDHKEPIVEDLPVSQITAGEFGKTRYVMMEWNRLGEPAHFPGRRSRVRRGTQPHPAVPLCLFRCPE